MSRRAAVMRYNYTAAIVDVITHTQLHSVINWRYINNYTRSMQTQRLRLHTQH